MNIQTPIEAIGNHILNNQIKAQANKWDAEAHFLEFEQALDCLLYTSPSPRDKRQSRMPSSA